MAAFSIGDPRNPSVDGKEQDVMGKKRPVKPTWRSEKSKYFPAPLNVQSCEPLKAIYDQLTLDIQTKMNITFLDMRKVTQQAICNLAMLALKHTLDMKGAKHLEKELGPIIRQMEVIVYEDMKARGRDLEPEYRPVPEGFSSPASEEPQPASKRKKGKTPE